jgi:hypothetical protein
MIPEGKFKARAVDGALGKAGTGNEQIAIDFVFLEGEPEGQHITWYGYFSEKAVEYTLEALEHCGWQGEDLSDLTGIDRNEVYLVIQHEEDQQGQLRARVRYVNEAGGIALKERLNPVEAQSFAQRMRGTVLARRQQKGQAPVAQRAAAPRPNAQPARQPPLRNSPAPENDDIPF